MEWSVVKNGFPPRRHPPPPPPPAATAATAATATAEAAPRDVYFVESGKSHQVH